MAGVKHDPLADISLIADNLRDRYKSGFPILKEIIQNADDAGSVHLCFGFSKGLPDANHELLKNPAVFFINDGSLSETDADAILSIALGSKASNENAIGKFGLGMKSLFHLCEAFFYLSDQWDGGKEFHSNIFNPWGELRGNWESFDNTDKHLIQQHLKAVITYINQQDNTKTWFIVWVPLRKRCSHYDGSIIENYPGDEKEPPDFILDKDTDVHLGQLLPLLKRLRSISIWQPTSDNPSNLHCTTTIRLSDDAVRRQFHETIKTPNLSGKILFESGKNKNHIDYAGYENLLPEQLFQPIRVSEFWPNSYERDRATGKEKKVEDKAKPHLAIVICQRKADERAEAYFDWSVFLPLGTYPQVKLCSWVNHDDKYHTQVFIHGYFFVDAGRVGIHGIENFGKQSLDKIANNDELRTQWNALLATEGCLSYLPKALQQFVKTHRCGFERTQHLSEALFNSDFAQQYRSWLSKQDQWLCQLTGDEKSWELISANKKGLPLPAYPKDKHQRPWTVFKQLEKLNPEEYFFYDASLVCLLNPSNQGWTDDLVLQVLDIDIEAVFCDRVQFSYFNEFLDLPDVMHTIAIKEKLQSIARKGLGLSSDKFNKSKSEITRFLKFIPGGLNVVLNKVKLSGLWQQLAKIETRVLIIPKELAPESTQNNSLFIDDANLLLKALDAILGSASQSNLHDEAQALVEEIIGLVADKESLLKECVGLRLFKIHDLASKKDKFVAQSDLRGFINQKSLFRYSSGSSGLGDDKYSLGKDLLQAIEECEIYFIDSKNKEISLGQNEKLSECNEKSCLAYIDYKQPTLKSTNSRTKLLERLSSYPELTIPEKRAFRYLLHADFDHYNVDSVFLLSIATELDPIWEKLARMIYQAGDDDWCLIDQALVNVLTNKLSNQLGVNKVNIEQILTALSKRLPQINFQQLHFNPKESETILLEIQEENLWKQLPWHETDKSERVAITKQCFLDNDLLIPDSLAHQVTRIKKSTNKAIAKQQNEWIHPLDKQALVQIILSSQSPSDYSLLILEQFPDISIDGDLRQLLRTTYWLKTNNEQPLKPEDIIVIKGMDDGIKRLTTECAAGYYAVDDLHTDIQRHEHFDRLKALFSHEQDGLECLFLMLGESKRFSIGTLGFKSEELLKFAEIIADALDMPGWALLAKKQVNALLTEGDVELIKPILKPLPVENYPKLLKDLIKIHKQLSLPSQQFEITRLFNAYLAIFAACPNIFESLKTMQLLNQQDHWVMAEQLCFGIEGVDKHCLMNREQARCLSAIIHSGQQRQERSNTLVVENIKFLRQSTPETLKTYFKDWEGLVENELIGLFISLLGGRAEIEQAANGFLGKRSVEGVRNSIDWLIKRGDATRNVLFDGLDQHQAIRQMEFLIRIEEQDSINVASIFNVPITVPLDSHPDTLIVDHSFKGQYQCVFQLRKLNIINGAENQLSTLLKNSAEWLLKEVYEQSGNLGKVWAELGESDQLDIAVARGLILDELPGNLRQLSLQKTLIHGLLQNYQNAKSQKKELELTGANTQTAERDIQQALDGMQEALINDESTQSAVLDAIKSKITNHQYQTYSVPFELFQNADDAVVEYAEMLAHPVPFSSLNELELDIQQQQFSVLSDDNTLTFIHWGRAINFFRGAEGFPGKERGFQRDLEKMLLLNTSDKHTESLVTGKFGLGFKSVHLISNRPKLLSGRLGVEIFAAMLPEPLAIDDRERLRACIEQAANTKLTATAIELPLIEGIENDDVLGKFKSYAGVLTAFSKGIKHINFNQEHVISWNEQIVFTDLPTLRKSRLSLGGEKIDAIKLVFADEYRRYEMLFAFGATGFKAFPWVDKESKEALPKIWVLAPTHDEASMDFLLNADFDVDMGRLQLAHDSLNNRHIARELGKNLTQLLRQLSILITTDWENVRQKLDLAQDRKPYDFWHSLWLVLVSSWVRKEDNNKVHQLVKVMLTEPQDSFVQLLSYTPIIPNGLWDSLQTLVYMKSITHVIKGVLSQEVCFKLAMKQLSAVLQADQVIHEDVKDEMFKLLPEKDKKALRWPTFDLSTLAEKTFPDCQCDIHAATAWGELLNETVKSELEKNEERKKEQKRLEQYSATLKFINQSNDYTSVEDLLDSQFTEQEEKLRAAFAPDDNILNTKYDQKAAAFFRMARPKMQAKLEQMMQWALAAKDLTKQTNVLLYLLRGEKSDELAKEIRGQSWLNELHEQSEHFADWSRSDVNNVLIRKLASDEKIERVHITIPTAALKEELNPNIVLNNVYNWWLQNKSMYLDKYNKLVYPEGHFPKIIDEQNSIDRDGWMTLLFLGSLHTVGRARDEQHRTAIEHFKDKGWWDVFIQENPQDAPEQWMQVLDEYLQDQLYRSQYDSWMMRFVSLYRFARWLDDYANVWLAINHQTTGFSMESVLNTASSPLHAGGGVIAPQLSRTLGIGANFILRELVRHGVLSNPTAVIFANEHCFVPHLRVRKLMDRLGMALAENVSDTTQSKDIYQFISEHLGKEKATFAGCFDIPLQIIAKDFELESRLFSNTLIESFDNQPARLLDVPNWAWDILGDISSFVDLVIHNNLPEPIVGYELCDSDGSVLLELELAWERQRVGIVVDEADNLWTQVQRGQKVGWQIFTVDELRDELQRFLGCFQQQGGS